MRLGRKAATVLAAAAMALICGTQGAQAAPIRLNTEWWEHYCSRYLSSSDLNAIRYDLRSLGYPYSNLAELSNTKLRAGMGRACASFNTYYDTERALKRLWG